MVPAHSVLVTTDRPEMLQLENIYRTPLLLHHQPVEGPLPLTTTNGVVAREVGSSASLLPARGTALTDSPGVFCIAVTDCGPSTPPSPIAMASAWPGNRQTISVPSKKIQCPRCLQSDGRVVEGHRSVCGLCSKSLRRVYQFCWACRREWPRTGSLSQGHSCSLPQCALRAALLSAEKIMDPNSAAFGCPFFRACPGCKALLTHDGVGCSNITCPHCDKGFCFRCLRDECYPEEEYEYNFSGLSGDDDDDDDDDDEDGDGPCVLVDNSSAVLSL